MKQFVFSALACVLAVLSCEPIDLTSRRDFVRPEIPGGGALNPPEPVPHPVFYAVGLDFKPGYDWRRDPEFGFSQCRMFLYGRGAVQTSFDVGYSQNISSDADMVRCRDGHIYTDFSTDSETVIKKDGVEIFRYPGREMIMGLLVKEDGIYTTGMPREGKGWTYRKNGVVVLSGDEGELFGDFYDDAGGMVFGYAVRKYGYYSADNKYYIVRDGITTQISLPDTKTEIRDFRSHRGSVYVLTKSRAEPYARLWKDNVSSVLPLYSGVPVEVQALWADDESIYVTGKLSSQDSSGPPIVWKGDKIFGVFSTYGKIDAFYPDGEEMLVVGHSLRTGDCFVFFNGEYEPMPSGYVFSGKECAAFVDGHYCLCLNPEQPDICPLMIVDGVRTELDINGWFAGLSYRMELSSQDSVLDKS